MSEKILFKKWYFIDRGESLSTILVFTFLGSMVFLLWLMLLYDATIGSEANQLPPVASFLISFVPLFGWLVIFRVFPRKLIITSEEVRFHDNRYSILIAFLLLGLIKKIPLKKIKKFWIDKSWIYIITVDKKNYEINTANFNEGELRKLAKIFRERKIIVLDKYLRDLDII